MHHNVEADLCSRASPVLITPSVLRIWMPLPLCLHLTFPAAYSVPNRADNSPPHRKLSALDRFVIHNVGCSTEVCRAQSVYAVLLRYSQSEVRVIAWLLYAPWIKVRHILVPKLNIGSLRVHWLASTPSFLTCRINFDYYSSSVRLSQEKSFEWTVNNRAKKRLTIFDSVLSRT